MNSLKVAADALKKSPKLMRKRIEKIAGKHEQLEEDKDIQGIRDNLVDGITFFVKKLGCLKVEAGQMTGCTEESVKKLVNMTKKSKAKSNKTLQKLSMTVSPEMVRMNDAETKEVIKEIPIYRMSYCTADQHYPKVFAFIARPGGSKDLHCHAFLTNKPSMAEAIALTISEAFEMSFESWETSMNRRKSAIEEQCEEEAREIYEDLGKDSQEANFVGPEVQVDILTFDDKDNEIGNDGDESASIENASSLNQEESSNMVSFVCQSLQQTKVYEEEEQPEDEFQRLAEERSSKTILNSDVKKTSLKAKGVCLSDFLSVKKEDLNLSISMEDLKEIEE